MRVRFPPAAPNPAAPQSETAGFIIKYFSDSMEQFAYSLLKSGNRSENQFQ